MSNTEKQPCIVIETPIVGDEPQPAYGPFPNEEIAHHWASGRFYCFTIWPVQDPASVKSIEVNVCHPRPPRRDEEGCQR